MTLYISYLPLRLRLFIHVSDTYNNYLPVRKSDCDVGYHRRLIMLPATSNFIVSAYRVANK